MNIVIAYITIRLIILTGMIGLYMIIKGPYIPNFDKEENNHYGSFGPSGRMINKFGY